MANKPSSEFSLRLILKKIVSSTDQRNTSFYECLGYSWSSVLDPGSGYRSIFGLTPTKRVTFIGADLNHVLSGLLTQTKIWPSQLTKDWLSAIRLHWGTLCFIPGNGAHVCWIEEKYMVIHRYGIKLNTVKSADQYYSSYSYQSSSLISYLMYNDLHHDCKPNEQTREIFSLLVQSLAAGISLLL